MWVETTDFRFIHSRAVSHSSPLLQQHIKHWPAWTGFASLHLINQTETVHNFLKEDDWLIKPWVILQTAMHMCKMGNSDLQDDPRTKNLLSAELKE